VCVCVCGTQQHMWSARARAAAANADTATHTHTHAHAHTHTHVCVAPALDHVEWRVEAGARHADSGADGQLPRARCCRAVPVRQAHLPASKHSRQGGWGGAQAGAGACLDLSRCSRGVWQRAAHAASWWPQRTAVGLRACAPRSRACCRSTARSRCSSCSSS
jgi:hypothetical protein